MAHYTDTSKVEVTHLPGHPKTFKALCLSDMTANYAACLLMPGSSMSLPAWYTDFASIHASAAVNIADKQVIETPSVCQNGIERS